MCFWYRVKSNLSSVRVNTSVDWTKHFLQGTKITQPCLYGRVVDDLDKPYGRTRPLIFSEGLLATTSATTETTATPASLVEKI